MDEVSVQGKKGKNNEDDREEEKAQTDGKREKVETEVPEKEWRQVKGKKTRRARRTRSACPTLWPCPERGGRPEMGALPAAKGADTAL